MYVNSNPRTKKALKESVKNGDQLTVFQPNAGLFGASAEPPKNGRVTLEGPHYPEPHKWYAQADLVDGVIVKVI